MTQKRLELRARLMSLLVQPTAPPLWLGVVVAASLIAAETLLVFVLKSAAPENTFGAVFLLGVLVVSAGWGIGLAVATTVASALAYIYFHMAPVGGFLPIETQDAIAIATFLPVAFLANALAGQARSRAAEANQRRREAEALAEQQAALRRVATLVARAAPPAEVFSAVAEELARCLGVPHSALVRYENNGTAVVVAREEPGVEPLDLRLHTVIRAPVVVDGRPWGAAVVGSMKPEPLPPDTKARVGDFAGLVATAIANAQAREELTASRARIVTAADVARRRVERDLHDGAQQRLVSLGLELRMAEASLPPGQDQLREQLSGIVSGLTGVSQDLQEISRGIHPAILSKGGLGPALKALARRSAIPVALHVHADGRLPESVEVGVYYVVAESLTNAAKHAQASEVEVRVEVNGSNVRLSICDDGIGGADPAKGSGLVGLSDRVAALGGRIEVCSPAGAGTELRATIPIGTA